MKKVTVVITLLMVVSHLAHGQTFAEWFKQKKTQKKYLAQQIGLLQVYLGALKKGYNIVDGGLTTIRNIKNGEFGLHDVFYTSLKKVNPAIGGSVKVAAILSCHQEIKNTCHALVRAANDAALSLVHENEWLQSICIDVLADLSNDRQQLMAIVTDGKLEMTNDERLRQIDQLYLRTKRLYQFCQSLLTDYSELHHNRLREHLENEYLQLQIEK